MVWTMLAIWITVLNPEGISNGNATFRFGMGCLVELPAHADTIGRLHDGRELYKLQSHEVVYGVTCPGDTLFAETALTWQSLNTRAQEIDPTQKALYQEIQKLLEK